MDFGTAGGFGGFASVRARPVNGLSPPFVRMLEITAWTVKPGNSCALHRWVTARFSVMDRFEWPAMAGTLSTRTAPHFFGWATRFGAGPVYQLQETGSVMLPFGPRRTSMWRHGAGHPRSPPNPNPRLTD